MSDEENDARKEPAGSFEIYRAEGDVLFKHGEYKKALQSYCRVCLHLYTVDVVTSALFYLLVEPWHNPT